MMKRFPLFALLLCFCSSVFAQSAKLSPLVRRAAMEQHIEKGKSRALLSTYPQRSITAFVRTTDMDVLRQEGCEIYAQWDDICIASIPINKLETLAEKPSVIRIEAGESCQVTNDTTAIITKANEVWSLPSTSASSTSLTGEGVVVGLMDAGFDLTHPTYLSPDGQTYRVKAFWDMLDFTTDGEAVLGEDGTALVGRQYIGESAILAKKHSADGLIMWHGSHTSGTAAGSGYNGHDPLPGETRYSGMAPNADICLVANYVGSNSKLVPEEERYKYTSATDMLGFKYIFDYAESVGKPCVISFSEGSHDELYESKLYSDVLKSIVGPGKILCASAGNEGGGDGTYLMKKKGVERNGAFIALSKSNYGLYIAKSDQPIQIILNFYQNGKKEKEWTYDTTELSQYADSVFSDTVVVNEERFVVYLCSYPSCFDDTQWATDIAVCDLQHERLGFETPISMLVEGIDNQIEIYSGGGFFIKNSLDPSLNNYEVTHNILFPGAASSAICVGSTTHRHNIINADGETVKNNWGSGGLIARYSSRGPAISGIMKPDVTAPGAHTVSSKNSFWQENHPDSGLSSNIAYSDYNGRSYPWCLESGTSMSTPVVAGIIALWLQECPTLSPDDIREVLAHSCTHPDESLTYPNNTYGAGEIDALAGLEYIRQNISRIESLQTESVTSSYYDLLGRKVTENYHGIQISNTGKSTIIMLKK